MVSTVDRVSVRDNAESAKDVSMSLVTVPKTKVAVDAAMRLDSHLAHFRPVLEARFLPINGMKMLIC